MICRCLHIGVQVTKVTVAAFLLGEITDVKLKVFPTQPVRKVVSTLSNIFFFFDNLPSRGCFLRRKLCLWLKHNPCPIFTRTRKKCALASQHEHKQSVVFSWVLPPFLVVIRPLHSFPLCLIRWLANHVLGNAHAEDVEHSKGCRWKCYQHLNCIAKKNANKCLREGIW